MSDIKTKGDLIESCAFTLIELLVVVLIIGILSAIALPQYNKAVEKAKATQALTLLKSAYQHAAVYYLANGEYPNSFADMGFQVPWTGSEKWSTVGDNYEQDTKSDGEWSLQLYHAADGNLVLMMGRLNGKYQGAGFVMSVVNPEEPQIQGVIHCAERTKRGILFSTDLNAGDYCVKIMNGTEVDATDNYRKYALP